MATEKLSVLRQLRASLIVSDFEEPKILLLFVFQYKIVAIKSCFDRQLAGIFKLFGANAIVTSCDIFKYKKVSSERSA